MSPGCPQMRTPPVAAPRERTTLGYRTSWKIQSFVNIHVFKWLGNIEGNNKTVILELDKTTFDINGRSET